MKTALRPVEHPGKLERLQGVEDLWDACAAEPSSQALCESRTDVLDEIERRAAWRDLHPGQAKSLSAMADALGVRL